MDKSYRQADPDHPLQVKRLPPSRPELDLPLFIWGRREEWTQTLFLLVIFSGLAALAVFVSHGARVDVLLPVLFVGFLMYHLGRSFRMSHWTGVGTVLLVIIAMWLYVECRDFQISQTVVAFFALTGFAWSFARHYAFRATVAPLQKDKAQALRAQWSRKIDRNAAVALCVPLASLAVAVFGETIEATAIAIIFCFSVGFPFLLSAFLSPVRSMRGFVEGLLSWFCYTHLSGGRAVPGVFRSPAGSWHGRMFLTITVMLLVALPIGTLSSLTAAVAFAEHEGIFLEQLPDESGEAGNVDSYPKGQMLTGLLYLALLSRVPCVMLPALVTLFAAFFVASPILAPAFSVASEPEDPEWFYHLVERIQTSGDAIERDSLFWGIIASDGAPILVPREIVSSHIHLMGGTQSGKTSMILCPLIEQLVLGCVDK